MNIDWTLHRKRLGKIAAALSGDLSYDLVKILESCTDWNSVPALLKVISHLEVYDAVDLLQTAKKIWKFTLLGASRWGFSQTLGNIFELSVKKRLQNTLATSISFDVPLPNGRDIDVRAIVAGVPLNIECSIIGESESDTEYWDDLIEGEEAVRFELERWGIRYEHEPSIRNGDPYADARRLYVKAFDKLASKADYTKCQLSTTEPNLLCFGMPAPTSISARGIETDWGIEGLFEPQLPGVIKAVSPHMKEADLTLRGFLEFAISEMISQGKIDHWPPDRVIEEMLQLPRLIGGVALFDGLRLVRIERNNNALAQNSISDGHIDAFRKAMKDVPRWNPTGPPSEE